MGERRLPVRSMLLAVVLLVTAVCSVAMESTDRAEVDRMLEKFRYSWNDEELPIDDLLFEGKADRPTEIAADKAVEDVKRLFYLFSHGYSGYGFFEEGKNWERAEQNILAELQTKRTWRVRELPHLFRKHLGFIRDCHLKVGSRSFADHRDFWYDANHLVQKAPDGYHIRLHGTRLQLTAINGENPEHFLYPSLNESGEAVYRIGCLAKVNPGPFTLNLTGDDGPSQLTAVLQRSSFDHFSRKPFDRDTIGGIPVLRVRSFSDHYWKQLEEFVGTARSLKDSPAVIVDVRGNRGGNERWPIAWIKGMSGVRAEWPFIFSELRSRTAVAGRANAMRYWARVTPDSVFLKKEVERYRKLIAGFRSGDQIAGWTPPLFPDSSVIPNRTTIVVITNRLVGSAGEGFVMRVSRLEHVVVVGENTRGALTFGNISLHRLPNSGLDIWMPVNFGLFPDLKFREEVGLEPDYWVPAADALNFAVAAIRNGTIGTEITLTPEMKRQRFVPEDSRHVWRKILIVCGFVLVGLIWLRVAWKKGGRLWIPGSAWITTGVIWIILGHANGKILMAELGTGLVAFGVIFMLGSLVKRCLGLKQPEGSETPGLQ